jgi:hypothetical protein
MVTKLLFAALASVLIPIFWGPAVIDLIKAQRHASCAQISFSTNQTSNNTQTPSESEGKGVLERLID